MELIVVIVDMVKIRDAKDVKTLGGCPFGKQCFIAKYVLTGGKDSYEMFKSKLINEVNDLNVSGMPKIEELTPINGAFVNLTYRLPNGQNVQFLDNDDIYLANQVECEFNNGEMIRLFGIVANMDFILVSEYGPNGDNPELIIYKKR